MINTKSIVSACFCLITLFSASVSFGAGFQIPEQGAASMGMAMGGIGKADDLSTIYHNPAGLTQLPGTRIYGALPGIAPKATYTRDGFDGQDNKDDVIPVPMLAISSDFGGKVNNMVFAFGVNAPFGLRNEYDETGPQRYLSTKIALAPIYAGPYAAWKLSPQFSIGAGVQYVYASAEISQKINYGGALYMQAAQQNPALADPSWNENPAMDGNLTIDEASDSTIAGNIGLLWTPSEMFQAGLSWRSGVELEIEGDVTLTIPETVTQMSGGLMQSLSTKGQTTVSLPQLIGAGVSYKPMEQLTLISDINWLNWSVYKDIDFYFDDNTPYFPDTKNPRDWEDTIVFRLGAEYLFSERYAVRAGYLYDQSPIPKESLGPELPTGDRQGLTLGFGVQWERVQFDVAYAHLFIEERTVTESIREPEPLGKYETSANIFGASVGYTF